MPPQRRPGSVLRAGARPAAVRTDSAGSGVGSERGALPSGPESPPPDDDFQAARLAWLQQAGIKPREADPEPAAAPGVPAAGGRVGERAAHWARSCAGASLLDGAFDEKESAESFQQARLAWLKQANSAPAASGAGDGKAPAAEASAVVVGAAAASTAAAGGQSLLDGDFDEAASAAAFRLARLEWLRSTQPTAGAEAPSDEKGKHCPAPPPPSPSPRPHASPRSRRPVGGAR